MRELIERLEKATASRVLDCEIRLAVLGDTQYGWKRDPKSWRKQLPSSLSEYLEAYRDVIDADDALQDEVVPRYTSSIDAALTLIDPKSMNMLEVTGSWEPSCPEAWPAWGVRWYPPGSSGASWHARTGSAPTPALALCVAALKARAPANLT